jgi:predicted membrane channel-forming protein YqfA (hemolysin III family)
MENAKDNGTDDQNRYRHARARVRAMRGFYIHLMVYLLVNAGLITINVLMQRDGWWWQWAAFSWGIGIVAHAATVFVFPGFLGRDWERRKIKEIMSRERDE